MYAYEMLQEMARLSGGVLQFNTLYIAIYRLQEHGYISPSETVVTESNRTRVYFSITEQGKMCIRDSIGSAQYAKMTQNTEAADVAHRLYRSITKRVERGDFLTEPYPVPDGYQVHGIPMILVDTVQEYMDMRLSLIHI